MAQQTYQSMKKLILLFIFLSYQAVSQKVYQTHQVDSQATPSGGLSLFNQFLSSNVHVPFRSSINGIKAKIFVKGIVETDGSMTEIEILKGIDSLCDKEAVRVLGLYKAWQPAVLKGKKVRQTVVSHVLFEAPAKENFDSTQWSMIYYYNEKLFPVTDPKLYKYRSIIHLDEQGYYDRDIVYEETKNGKWKQVSTVPFKRKELWYRIQDEPGTDSVKAYELSAEDGYEVNYVPFLTFQEDGKRLSYREYRTLGKALLQKKYYLSGMLKEVESFDDSSSIRINFYANGMMKSVIETPVLNVENFQESKILSAWKQEGAQVVKNGNGYWKFNTTTVQEGNTVLVEEGALTAGNKTGKWIGKLADSTLYYTELYENGKLQEGTSFVNGEKISYKNKALQPKFKGGLTEFYKFLGQNIKYPSEAARNRISGRVYLSFVVCEDGSLCDYEVIKGVRRDLDNEALRVVKEMSGKWEPGVMRGQKVRVKYNLPINFQLQ